jgi:O-antigen/teichoic acid export membrane protein
MFRRLIRTVASTSAAHATTAAVTIAQAAVLAQSLGPDRYGMVAIFVGVQRSASVIGSFESWQVLTRELSAGGRSDPLGAYRRARSLDVLGASVAAVAAACLAGALHAMGRLPEHHVLVFVLLLAAAAAAAVSAPVGTLRMAGRFTVVPLVRLACASILLAAFWGMSRTDALSVEAVAAAYAASELAYAAVLAVLAAAERRSTQRAPESQGREAVPGSWWTTLRSNDWRLVRYAYLHSTLKIGIREFDVIVASVLLDNRELGYFRLVKQLASGVGAVSLPLFQVLFPELARLSDASDRGRFVRLLRFSVYFGAAIGATVVAVAALAGVPVIAALFGPAFVPAHGPLMIWLAGTAISFATIGMHPAQLALGQAGASFRALLTATAAYYAAVAAWAPAWGLHGFALAFVVFYLVWTLLQGLSLAHRLKTP